MNVVLTDLIMPVMGGMELLRNIKQIKPKQVLLLLLLSGQLKML